MKKILVFIILLLSICNVSAMSLKVSDATGKVGEDVRVPIVVEKAENLGSMDLVIAYNAELLKVKSVGKGELNKGLISSNTNEQNGIISIAIADSKGINGNGEIAVITFNALKEGSSDVTIVGAKAYDVNTHLEITLNSTNGKVTISGKSTPGFEALLAIVAFLMLALRRKA